MCVFVVVGYREERKLRKWRKMIGVGGSDWKHYVRRKPNVVRRRIRKGIPDCLRGLVWQLISGSRDLLLMNPGVYEVIMSSYCLLYKSYSDYLSIFQCSNWSFMKHQHQNLISFETYPVLSRHMFSFRRDMDLGKDLYTMSLRRTQFMTEMLVMFRSILDMFSLFLIFIPVWY